MVTHTLSSYPQAKLLSCICCSFSLERSFPRCFLHWYLLRYRLQLSSFLIRDFSQHPRVTLLLCCPSHLFASFSSLLGGLASICLLSYPISHNYKPTGKQQLALSFSEFGMRRLDYSQCSHGFVEGRYDSAFARVRETRP